MQNISLFHAGLTVGVACVPLALVFVYFRFENLFQNGMETLVTALNRDQSADYLEMSQFTVDMHRNHELLKATVEQIQLQQADIKEIMGRRLARLSTRITREAAEEGDEEAASAAEDAQALLAQYQEQNGDVAPVPAVGRDRPRLRRRSSARHRS